MTQTETATSPAPIASTVRAFPRYPAYSDSGVPWLGQVPAHWEVKRLKFAASYVTSGSRGWAEFYSDVGPVFIRIGNLSQEGIDLKLDDVQHVSPPEGAEGERTRTQSGDVLVSITANIGSVGVVRPDLGEAYVNQHVALVRPLLRSSIPRWLGYCLLSFVGQYQFGLLLYGGTKDGLGLDDIKNLVMLLPPLAEQRAIAAFLDRETARLDALVAAKRRLIALLREKRAALISRTVTRGLDASAPRRDSGVPWLGEIPAHWEVKRLKYLISQPLQYGANEAAECEDLDWPRFVRITDIAEDGSLRPETFKSLPPAVAAPYLLREGDMLLARSGATVGKNMMYKASWGKACYAGYLIRARLDIAKTIPTYLAYFLASAPYWSWIASVTIQATIQNVSAEKYANLQLALPPLPEQHTIAAYLDAEAAKLDALVSAIERQIERLGEYRTALIAAAVTGQIDVRGRAASEEFGL